MDPYTFVLVVLVVAGLAGASWWLLRATRGLQPTTTTPAAQAITPPPAEASTLTSLDAFNCNTDPEDFGFEIVGESNYQPAIRRAVAEEGGVVGDAADGVQFDVVVMAEPDNPHDGNAIAVLHPQFGKLGYFSRKDAVAYRRAVLAMSEQGLVGACRAQIHGGGPDRPAYGVWLNLQSPEQMIADLEQLAAATD